MVRLLIDADLLATGCGHGAAGHSWRRGLDESMARDGRNEGGKASGDGDDRLHRACCCCCCVFGEGLGFLWETEEARLVNAIGAR